MAPSVSPEICQQHLQWIRVSSNRNGQLRIAPLSNNTIRSRDADVIAFEKQKHMLSVLDGLRYKFSERKAWAYKYQHHYQRILIRDRIHHSTVISAAAMILSRS